MTKSKNKGYFENEELLKHAAIVDGFYLLLSPIRSQKGSKESLITWVTIVELEKLFDSMVKTLVIEQTIKEHLFSKGVKNE